MEAGDGGELMFVVRCGGRKEYVQDQIARAFRVQRRHAPPNGKFNADGLGLPYGASRMLFSFKLLLELKS